MKVFFGTRKKRVPIAENMRHIAVGVNLTGKPFPPRMGPAADPWRAQADRLRRGGDSGATPTDPSDPGTGGCSRKPVTRGDQGKAPFTVFRPINATKNRCLPATKVSVKPSARVGVFPTAFDLRRATTRLPPTTVTPASAPPFPTITYSIPFKLSATPAGV